jgi:hypothetical protein
MLVALGIRDGSQKDPQRKIAKDTGLARTKIIAACFIIDNAPDQIELVLSGLSCWGTSPKFRRRPKKD